MDGRRQDRKTQIVIRLIQDLFEIGTITNLGCELVLTLHYRFEPSWSLKLVSERLATAGYTFTVDERDEDILLTINPRPRLKIPLLNIVMFLLTLVSVYFVSMYARYELGGAAEPLTDTLAALKRGEGIMFTLALISILFVHEMGHFIASRRRGIATSWPYFIPAPNLIGTFGAIIKSKSPFWNRRDLIEVGAAGPIAGWIVAVGWLWYGLTQSVVLSPDALTPGMIPFSLTGESILMRLTTLSLIGPAPTGYVYILSEAAFAGWVGLLVTAINLLPIGQLDGGHILYGLGRRLQHRFGIAAIAILLALGFLSPMWWIFALFLFIFGIKHPPTMNDQIRPSRTATWMAVVSIIIMIVSFTPKPF